MCRKASSLVLALMLIFCILTPITAYAVPPIIYNPCYQYIDSISVGFSIESGIAHCCGSARTNHYDTTTTIMVSLQKRAYGSTYWTSVKSWTSSAEGIHIASVNETKEVTSGYNYRLYVWVTITDGDDNVLEGAPMYSQII